MMKSLKDAANETGLSYYCIRGLCINGNIAYIKSGNKFYVNMQSLLAFCGEKLDAVSVTESRPTE